MKSIQKTLMAVAALAALALGGSALATAASTSSSSPAQTTAAGAPAAGRHSANGQTEQALTGDIAGKVEAAALADVSGGTIERVETDADHGSPYEAHVRKADGTSVEVLVDKDFKVTAVNAMGRP